MVDVDNPLIGQHFLGEFLKHAPSAIAMFDNDLRYLMVTDRWLSDYGLKDCKVIGRKHYDIFPEIPSDWRAMHQRTLDGETLSAEADPFLRGDGKLDFVRWRNVPWYAEDGSIGGMIMFTEVITDQVMMRRAMENVAGGFARFDTAGRHIFSNTIYADQLNTSPEALNGRLWQETIVEEDRPVIEDALQRLQHEPKVVCEVQAQREDGAPCYWRVSLIADHDREHNLAGHYHFVEDITARKQEEEEIRRKTEWLELTQTISHVGHWLVDARANTIYWSDEVYRIHGVDPESYQPSMDTAIDFYHPEDRGVVEENISKAVSAGQPFSFELRLVRPDGQVRWVASRGECRMDEDGELAAIFGVFQDITERRNTLEEIRFVKERCELAMRGASVGIWEVDPASGTVYWSRLLDDILGIENALSQEEMFDRLHPDDKGVLTGYQKSLGEKRNGDSCIVRMRHEDGHYVDIQLRGDAIRGEDNQIARLAGSYHDISAERRAEELRQHIWTILISQDTPKAEKFQKVLEAATEYFGMDLGLISVIEDDTYTVRHAVTPGGEVNPGDVFEFENTYCYHVYKANGPKAIHHAAESEISDHPCYENFGLESYIGAPLFVAGRRYGTVNFSSPEQRNRPFLQQDLQLIDQIAQWVGYEVDREQNLKSLQESEERFALAAEGSVVGIWEWKRDRELDYWSDQFYALIGYEPGELKPCLETFNTLLHPDDLEHATEAAQSHLARNTRLSVEYRLRCKNGDYRWFLGSGQADWDADDQPKSMVGTLMDVHDLKVAQETLEERTRWLERTNRDLDHFAYIASHDLRAPLRGMDQVSQWIEEDLEGKMDEDVAEKFVLLRSRISRMNQLLTDILAYSRAGKRESEPEDVDTGALVGDIVSWVDPPEGFKVKSVGPLPVIHSSRTLLEQLLLNLVSNAIKHHDRDRGVVTIRYVDHGEAHEFIIEDDGPGIPVEFQERIFKMFQTLKRRDEVEGSGIGLSIVNRLAESHGGSVDVRSPIDERGTAFHVKLDKTMPSAGQGEGLSNAVGA